MFPKAYDRPRFLRATRMRYGMGPMFAGCSMLDAAVPKATVGRFPIPVDTRWRISGSGGVPVFGGRKPLGKRPEPVQTNRTTSLFDGKPGSVLG